MVLFDALRGRSVTRELKKEKLIIDEIDNLLCQHANSMSDDDLRECLGLLQHARDENKALERLSKDFSSRWSRSTMKIAQNLTETCIEHKFECVRRSRRTADVEVEGMPQARGSGPRVGRPELARSVGSAHAKTCDYILLVGRQSPKSSTAMATFIETVSKLSHTADDDLVCQLTEPAARAFKKPPIMLTIEASWKKAEAVNSTNFWQSRAVALLAENEDNLVGPGTLRIHVAVATGALDHFLVADDVIGYDLEVTGVMSWKLADGKFELLIGDEAFSSTAVIDKINGAVSDRILGNVFPKDVGRMVRTMKLDRIVSGPNEPVVDGSD